MTTTTATEQVPTVSLPDVQPTAGYRGILRATAVLGSARFIGMVVSMTRSKVLAVLLGPLGVGLLGTYESITVMVMTVSGMGISTSGVREVAQSANDPVRTARTIKSIHRVAAVFGILGSIAMALLAVPISQYTFQDRAHAWSIVALSPTVALVVFSCGAIAISQGLGRITHVALNNLVGPAAGAIATVALVTLLRENGIVPALLLAAVATFAAAWIYCRVPNLPPVHVGWRDTWADLGTLIPLGLAVMNAAFLAAFVAYFARAIVARDITMEAVGLYVCAFGLSGKFIGLLLDAMRTDFYPKVSAAADHPVELNQVVNQQLEVALLLATPGLVATIAFAPWLIRIFYSQAFTDATVLLRLFAFGCFVSVICGPLRMIQLAKGKSLVCMATETGTNGFHILLIFALVKWVGLAGCGIAYVIHYTVQTVVSYIVARRLTGFRWSGRAFRTAQIFTVTTVSALALPWLLTGRSYVTAVSLFVTAVTLYSVRRVTGLLGPEHRIVRAIATVPLMGRLAVRA